MIDKCIPLCNYNDIIQYQYALNKLDKFEPEKDKEKLMIKDENNEIMFDQKLLFIQKDEWNDYYGIPQWRHIYKSEDNELDIFIVFYKNDNKLSAINIAHRVGRQLVEYKFDHRDGDYCKKVNVYQSSD